MPTPDCAKAAASPVPARPGRRVRDCRAPGDPASAGVAGPAVAVQGPALGPRRHRERGPLAEPAGAGRLRAVGPTPERRRQAKPGGSSGRPGEAANPILTPGTVPPGPFRPQIALADPTSDGIIGAASG